MSNNTPVSVWREAASRTEECEKLVGDIECKLNAAHEELYAARKQERESHSAMLEYLRIDGNFL